MEEKREFFVKYSDSEGNTCYSDPFKTPDEVIECHKRMGEDGFIVKRTTREERFDAEGYIRGLVAQKQQIEKTLKRLGWKE